MSNPGLHKTLTAEGEIAPYRIVAHGSADYAAAQAATDTEALIGTADELGKQSNGRVDVCLSGLPEVVLGGAVTRGAPLTADASGKAIVATTAGQRIIGFAMTSGVAGDIITYQHAPGTLAVAAA